jgi:hypothetical protein
VDDLIVCVGGSVAWFSSDEIFSNMKLRRIEGSISVDESRVLDKIDPSKV